MACFFWDPLAQRAESMSALSTRGVLGDPHATFWGEASDASRVIVAIFDTEGSTDNNAALEQQTPFRFEAVAVVKGVPAAALAYHNPSGALVDDVSATSGQEATPGFGQAGTADGVTANGQAGDDGDTAGVGGSGSGSGGGSVGGNGSRFRYMRLYRLSYKGGHGSTAINSVSPEPGVRISSNA